MALDFDPSSILSGADQGWTLNSSGSGVGGLLLAGVVVVAILHKG